MDRLYVNCTYCGASVCEHVQSRTELLIDLNAELRRKLEIAKEYLAANLDRETFEKAFKEIGE